MCLTEKIASWSTILSTSTCKLLVLDKVSDGVFGFVGRTTVAETVWARALTLGQGWGKRRGRD
jgi:hypothetical protein